MQRLIKLPMAITFLYWQVFFPFWKKLHKQTCLLECVACLLMCVCGSVFVSVSVSVCLYVSVSVCPCVCVPMTYVLIM